MNNFKNLITGVILSGMILSSCKKEGLLLYNAPDNIYFYPKMGMTYLGVNNDLDLTFAYGSPSATDTVIALPVAVTGSPQNTDRPLLLKADSSSTAIAGIHYELIKESLFIHAGKQQDTILIRLKRTADLSETVFRLSLNLMANEYFETTLKPMAPLYDDPGLRIGPVTHYQINFSDIALPPPGWQEYYFGTFTIKKWELINSLNRLDRSFFLNQLSYEQQGLLPAYSIVLYRYLIEKGENGETVYEEDGSEMTAGEFATN